MTTCSENTEISVCRKGDKIIISLRDEFDYYAEIEMPEEIARKLQYKILDCINYWWPPPRT